MRLIVVIGCLLCWKSAVVFAQTEDASKRTVHELGVIVQGIPSFGLDYKVGTDKSLWRFSALAGELYLEPYEVSAPGASFPFRHSFNLRIGHEWRKKLWDNFLIAYGVDLEGSYGQLIDYTGGGSLVNRNTQIYTGSISFVCGIHYIYKDRVNFSLNWLPNIYYRHVKVITDDPTIPPEQRDLENHRIGYIANFSNLRLVVAYRFFAAKNKS